jgi:hypothetical protein
MVLYGLLTCLLCAVWRSQAAKALSAHNMGACKGLTGDGPAPGSFAAVSGRKYDWPWRDPTQPGLVVRANQQSHVSIPYGAENMRPRANDERGKAAFAKPLDVGLQAMDDAGELSSGAKVVAVIVERAKVADRFGELHPEEVAAFAVYTARVTELIETVAEVLPPVDKVPMALFKDLWRRVIETLHEHELWAIRQRLPWDAAGGRIDETRWQFVLITAMTRAGAVCDAARKRVPAALEGARYSAPELLADLRKARVVSSNSAPGNVGRDFGIDHAVSVAMVASPVPSKRQRFSGPPGPPGGYGAPRPPRQMPPGGAAPPGGRGAGGAAS